MKLQANIRNLHTFFKATLQRDFADFCNGKRTFISITIWVVEKDIPSNDYQKNKEVWAAPGQGDLHSHIFNAGFYGTSSGDDDGNCVYK